MTSEMYSLALAQEAVMERAMLDSLGIGIRDSQKKLEKGISLVSAASVMVSTAQSHGVRPGSNPRAALQSLRLGPVSNTVAGNLIKENHYLHSYPASTRIALGVFLDNCLEGVVSLGVGPTMAYRVMKGAGRDDCLALTRFWLSGSLPSNGASRVLGILARTLKQNTSLKFLVTYADPLYGHVGTIYQAAGWIYIGQSASVPVYEVAGKKFHARSFAHTFGSHSLSYFREKGIDIKIIPQQPKFRYLKILDANLTNHLTVPVLPYPKKEGIWK